MKRLICISAIAIVSLFHLDISAQKKVSQDEVSRLYTNALAAMETRSYRQRSTVETFDDRDRPAVFKSVATTIRMHPNARHTIVQTEDASGVRLKENISIGNKSYSKEGDKEWREDPGESGSSGDRFTALPQTGRPTVETVVEYKGKTDDMSADLYIVTKKEKRGSVSLVFVKKYWFDKDRLLVKEVSESYYTNAKSLLRTSTTYEYDPNITIEAPIP